jgi:hypothetical protein
MTLHVSSPAPTTVWCSMELPSPEPGDEAVAACASMTSPGSSARRRGRPCAADRALWRDGHRPTKVSTFGTELAALGPDLPSNRWHRVLRRHLASGSAG